MKSLEKHWFAAWIVICSRIQLALHLKWTLLPSKVLFIHTLFSCVFCAAAKISHVGLVSWWPAFQLLGHKHGQTASGCLYMISTGRITLQRHAPLVPSGEGDNATPHAVLSLLFNTAKVLRSLNVTLFRVTLNKTTFTCRAYLTLHWFHIKVYFF